MKKIIPVLLAVIMSTGCAKKFGLTGVPACIVTKIEELKQQPKQNPPGQVDEYVYMGKRAFLFTAPCCDQYNGLYDADCNYICAPSGGITGKGDGNCSEFSKAVFVRTVWKDER